MLTTDDVAAIFGVSSWTVYRWHRDGLLRGVRVAPRGPLRFPTDEIEAIVAAAPASRRAVGAAEGCAAPADAGGAAPHLTNEGGSDA